MCLFATYSLMPLKYCINIIIQPRCACLSPCTYTIHSTKQNKQCVSLLTMLFVYQPVLGRAMVTYCTVIRACVCVIINESQRLWLPAVPMSVPIMSILGLSGKLKAESKRFYVKTLHCEDMVENIHHMETCFSRLR